MYKTGLILASGKGSRLAGFEGLSIPKHLRELRSGETIVGRVGKQLASNCDEIICTIRDESDRQRFEQALTGVSKPVSIIVKANPEEEFSELQQLPPLLKPGNVIQTNGDLVFPDGVVESFCREHGEQPYFTRGREGNPENMRGALDIFNSRISVVPSNLISKFSPKNKLVVIFELIKSLALGRVSKVPTLFNVDTPDDYIRARKYFSNSAV